ncbi:unnamed protein product [Camellia sinensis]
MGLGDRKKKKDQRETQVTQQTEAHADTEHMHRDHLSLFRIYHTQRHTCIYHIFCTKRHCRQGNRMRLGTRRARKPPRVGWHGRIAGNRLGLGQHGHEVKTQRYREAKSGPKRRVEASQSEKEPRSGTKKALTAEVRQWCGPNLPVDVTVRAWRRCTAQPSLSLRTGGVGSLEKLLLMWLVVQGGRGEPHRTGLREKADSVKPERKWGISPESVLPEILKSWRSIWERCPENWFASSRSVRR